MNPRIRFKKTTILPLRIALAFALVCLVFSPRTQAVTPPPDGGYPGGNTAEGNRALFSLTTGQHNTANGFHTLHDDTVGSDNTATGFEALSNNIGSSGEISTGNQNTAIGSQALRNNTGGSGNIAVGYRALFNNAGGFLAGGANTAVGFEALLNNSNGPNILGSAGNTAVGFGALLNNTMGSGNIALGSGAGNALTTGDNNIDIGNIGVAGESNTIRIGTAAADESYFQSSTFIAGIYATTTGSTTTLPVIVDANGQLGTAPSSERYKTDIKPMDKTSEVILAFKPVTFHYKNDTKGTPQFGLVAEDVVKVNPDLVARDAQGKVYTVRYDAVNAMLLNEFLKEHQTVQEQEATIALLKSTDARQEAIITELTSTDAKQEATIAKQQRQIDALTAGLQRVSAQVELSKAAPQTVADNQ